MATQTSSSLTKIRRINSGVLSSNGQKLKLSMQKNIRLKDQQPNKIFQVEKQKSEKYIYEGLNEQYEQIDSFCNQEQVSPWSVELPAQQKLRVKQKNFLINEQEINVSRLKSDHMQKIGRPQSGKTPTTWQAGYRKKQFDRLMQIISIKPKQRDQRLYCKTLKDEKLAESEQYNFKTLKKSSIYSPEPKPQSNPPEIQRIINKYFKQSPMTPQIKSQGIDTHSVLLINVNSDISYSDFPFKQNSSSTSQTNQINQTNQSILRGSIPPLIKSNFFTKSQESKYKVPTLHTTSREYFQKLSNKIREMKNAKLLTQGSVYTSQFGRNLQDSSVNSYELHQVRQDSNLKFKAYRGLNNQKSIQTENDLSPVSVKSPLYYTQPNRQNQQLRQICSKNYLQDGNLI